MLFNLTKDRSRALVRGLGNLWGREIEPSEAAEFSDFGNIKSTILTLDSEMEDIRPEHGRLINRIEKSRSHTISTNLMQTSLDEMALVRQAKQKIFAIRYFGMPSPSRFQYFMMDRATIDPKITLSFQPGERLLPILITGQYQDELSYEVPELIAIETAGTIRIQNLQLWLEPRAFLNEGTAKALDISGYGRHGDLSADYSSIWHTATAPVFWRFDGTNDSMDLGNILNDDGSRDFVIECWVRVQGANASAQEILSKKGAWSDHTDGFGIIRDTDNTLAFKISDGAASAYIASTATLLQNVWKHIAIAVDRNGTATWYVNGAAGGSGSVAAVGNGTNTTHFLIGALASSFGQVDLGGIRLYRFAAGGLPSWSTIAANHYSNEKAYYGL